MSNFRQTKGSQLEWTSVEKSEGHSNFHFVDEYFWSSPILRRILSLARKLKFRSIAVEKISENECELFAQENEALAARISEFSHSRVRRLLFFSGKKEEPGKLLGYTVFKEDYFTGFENPKFHIYEAVLRPVRDFESNNFLHTTRGYSLVTSLGDFQTFGNLYGQQNGMTFACAHVALRSVLSSVLPAGDLSYPEINEILGIDFKAIEPGKKIGLGPDQLETVFTHYGLSYTKTAFQPPHEEDPGIELEGEFQRHLYGVIESGLPALLGFETAKSRHMIPVLGHTFNEDTWVADSKANYFAQNRGWFSSESWLSSYVVHDDNFGPYYCIPRHYLSKDNFRILLGLTRVKTVTEALEIEAAIPDYAKKIAEAFSERGNSWQQNFALFAEKGVLVLRTLLLKREEYLEALVRSESWAGERMNEQAISRLKDKLPEHFWMVELSAPELFAGTRHKFGEVLLACDQEIPEGNGLEILLAARVPGLVLWPEGDNLERVESGIENHVPLFELSPAGAS